MKSPVFLLLSIFIINLITGCSSTYKAAPVPFRSPSNLGNSIKLDGLVIGARAYEEKVEASKVFGFDILGAGMLPVQVIFDNKSHHTYEINGQQSFLEDDIGNLWPILNRETAYQRASKNVKTEQIMEKGASGGLMGSVAGAITGAAIGILSGESVSNTMGKGAAIGGTVGIISGGIEGHRNNDINRKISEDLHSKSLQNKTILPDMISYGILFYPAEAVHAKELQLCIVETDTGKSRRLIFKFTTNIN